MIPGLLRSSLRDRSIAFDSIAELRQLLEYLEELSAKDERRVSILFYSGLALLIGGLSWIHVGLGVSAAGAYVMVVTWAFVRDIMRGKSVLQLLRHVAEHHEQVDQQMEAALQEAMRDAYKQN